jgi:hypothetical protein
MLMFLQERLSDLVHNNVDVLVQDQRCAVNNIVAV